MKKFAVSATMALAMAAIASASVTIDANGIGFVGKGDVQTALALNNAAMQTLVAANGVKFTYVKVDTYQVVNAWATGNPDKPVSLSSHTATVTTMATVNSDVAFDPRQGQKQYTGFNLKGFVNTIQSGEVPVVSPTVT